MLLLVFGGIGYVVYPFVTPVKNDAVEERANAMCERLYQGNNMLKLYPLPPFFDCSCYAHALAEQYPQSQAADFLNRKREDVLALASNFIGGSRIFFQSDPQDVQIIRSVARACLPDRLKKTVG